MIKSLTRIALAALAAEAARRWFEHWQHRRRARLPAPPAEVQRWEDEGGRVPEPPVR